ncbi:hypothetical protein ROA7023_01901 [Roseisalinus antarcticus]|uniref:Uncharacterized protein n=1 Tax=Roseisalinus antarcticus TaxID=254357 RepID=A0A1Y5STK7_9RHOB|nr:hypothetical protein ROA7023_01901 [Roseisalinus antarcticus]
MKGRRSALCISWCGVASTSSSASCHVSSWLPRKPRGSLRPLRSAWWDGAANRMRPRASGGSAVRYPIRLGRAGNDVFSDTIPMRFVTFEYDNLDVQPRRLVHGAKRQCQMIRRPRVLPVNRAPTIDAKSPGHFGPTIGHVAEFAQFSRHGDLGSTEHGTYGMARPAQSPTLFAMALSNDDGRAIGSIRDCAAKAFTGNTHHAPDILAPSALHNQNGCGRLFMLRNGCCFRSGRDAVIVFRLPASRTRIIKKTGWLSDGKVRPGASASHWHRGDGWAEIGRIRLTVGPSGLKGGLQRISRGPMACGAGAGPWRSRPPSRSA